MGVDSLFQDIRYATRTLRRAPLFAATVAATMGLGLGLLGSAFTLLNAYLLKPIDLPDPRALYSLSWDTDSTRRHRFSLTDYEALQPEARRFAALAAAQDVTVMQDSVSRMGLLVTGNYFELLGARPALGRLLRLDDAAVRGGVAVVVLSHQTWRSRYGSNPAIVGQRISLGRQRFEVVGITEPHAYLPGQDRVSFWAPLTMAGAFPGVDPWSEPDAAALVVVGRLRQDATAASVHAWLETWLRQRFPPPSDLAPVAVRIDSLATRIPLNGVTLTMFVFIMSAFGLVLLVASANVTNLMLARALARQPEVALRLALGASRWRVARQLIVESLLLAIPAAATGLALVIVTTRVFAAVILATVPGDLVPVENILVPLDPDWRVMAFLASAAVLSAVLITLAPAGRLAGMRLAHASRGEVSSDARGSRLRSGLVAMQIGACALFLVGTVALLDEASRLANPRPNLAYERVSLIGIDPKVRDAVATRLASDAAVEQVAVAWKPPLFAGPLPTARVTASATSIALNAGYTGVSAEYFALFDIQIVRGRTFTAAEATAGAPVALVSEATAAALWPGLDPLGQTLDLAAVPDGVPRKADGSVNMSAPAPRPRGRVQVIGVTEDVVSGNIFDPVDVSCVYFPTSVQALTEMSLLVRTRTDDVEALRSAVTTAVKEVAPEMPFQVLPIRTMAGLAVWIFQAFSVAASVLSVVGLLFAYSGTHAVVSFVVAQRTREFGVRMALGASAWRIVRGMLIETSRTASIGLAAGLAVAAGLIGLIRASVSILPDFGARPFVEGATIVLVATAVAAVVPLRAAARIDPAQALRTE
ncbi:MAG TPA: ABC transporter permease [Vicinamibacterales bacterium]|nr:ABC transporter permease [Vicinamibacterales bacterium]